jgi:hypothetical protein
MPLSERGSLDAASEVISSAEWFSEAKTESGMTPRQSMTAKMRANVFFKVFCITSSFQYISK